MAGNVEQKKLAAVYLFNFMPRDPKKDRRVSPEEHQSLSPYEEITDTALQILTKKRIGIPL